MPDADASAVDVAADNDVVLKAASYRVADMFWPDLDRVGVLGSAKFVVSSRIARGRVRNREAASAALAALLVAVSELEPTDEEESMALALEVAAQEGRLSLDAGESQLAAIAAIRDFSCLDTGDKRGIAALERLAGASPQLTRLYQRVRCLEQLALRAIPDDGRCALIAAQVCGEPDVDTALTICFRCVNGAPERDRVMEGLGSYVEDVRRNAPRLLAPG